MVIPSFPVMGSLETNIEAIMTRSVYVEHRNDVHNRMEMTRLVVGFSIGDGCLWKARRGKNALYCFSQIATHVDYMLWQATQLSQLTKVRMLFIPATVGHADSYRMATMTHPLYTTIQERMYLDRRKTITRHDANLMNMEILAYLYQDDGYYDNHGTNPRATICTDCFTEAENYTLRDAIASNTQLHSDVIRYKNRYRLRFNVRQTSHLRDALEPFVCPSFYYKLGKEPSIETVVSWLERLNAQDNGIVRSLLKDNDYYRNVLA